MQAMQNIYDMTTAEVAALTEEEIKSFIDIECASKGVMLLPPEPEKPVQPQIVQDVTMYEFMGVHFATTEAAAAVMNEIAKHKQFTYDYKGGTRIFHQGNHYAADRVNVVQGMKEETYLNHKAAIDSYDRAKTAYDSAKKAYDKAIDARKGIVREVNDHVDNCRDILREGKLINDTLARYVMIAKGDTKIAYGFLVAAKPGMDLNHDHKELWATLEKTHNPPEAAPADEAEAA
jgi:hypothetical protein